MNYDLINNNKVYLQGIVNSEPVHDHDVMDEQFYSFTLRVARLSGQDDLIPVTISSKMLDNSNIKKGEKLALRGQFRSHNKLEDGKSRLILSVFCKEICAWDNVANPNVVELSGYICKEPIYRTTPFMREICDVLLAVNRNFDKSDYIPCIAWGKNAQFVRKIPVGSRLQISGRIQSREYSKQTAELTIPIKKIAYEVSVSTVALIENENAL